MRQLIRPWKSLQGLCLCPLDSEVDKLLENRSGARAPTKVGLPSTKRVGHITRVGNLPQKSADFGKTAATCPSTVHRT